MKRTTTILLTIGRDDNNVIKVDTKVLRENDVTVTASVKKQKRTKQYEGPVLQYDFRGIFVKEWDSVSQAAKLGGFKHGSITNVIKGKCMTHRGYTFKLKNVK